MEIDELSFRRIQVLLFKKAAAAERYEVSINNLNNELSKLGLEKDKNYAMNEEKFTIEEQK